MTFTALKPLLNQCKALDLKIVPDGDHVTVIVFPAPLDGQQHAALKQPIQLSGSFDELDEQFAAAVTQLAGTRAKLIESIEAAELLLAAAKKEADEKAVKALQRKSKTVAPAQESAGGEDAESDSSGDSPSPSRTQPPGPPAAEVDDKTLNLFG